MEFFWPWSMDSGLFSDLIQDRFIHSYSDHYQLLLLLGSDPGMGMGNNGG